MGTELHTGDLVTDRAGVREYVVLRPGGPQTFLYDATDGAGFSVPMEHLVPRGHSAVSMTVPPNVSTAADQSVILFRYAYGLQSPASSQLFDTRPQPPLVILLLEQGPRKWEGGVTENQKKIG